MLLRNITVALLVLLAVFGPAAGFVTACALEYVRASRAGGDAVWLQGTVTAPDGRLGALLEPYEASTITHALRQAASHAQVQPELLWISRDYDALARIASKWIVLPSLAVPLGAAFGRFVAHRLSVPRYWPILRHEHEARRAATAATCAGIRAGIAALPLSGIAAGLTHISLGNPPFSYATGIPSMRDILIAAGVATIVPTTWACGRNLAAMRRFVTWEQLHCVCGYHLPPPRPASCPECGRDTPTLPPALLLFRARPRILARVLAAAACAPLVIGALALVDAPHVRPFARSLLYRTPPAAKTPVQLRAWWADAIVVRYDDGVGLVITSRRLRPSAAPERPGRQPAAMNGLSGRFAYATAFWPHSTTPGALEAATIISEAWTVRADDGDPIQVPIRCGPHLIDAWCHESQFEFNQYTFKETPDAVFRESSETAWRNLADALRQRADAQEEIPP